MAMDVPNYVASLNEFAQRSRFKPPKYEDVCTDGPDHCRTFTIRVVVNDTEYPVGAGRNKKEAKQNAAKNALDAIYGESGLLSDSADMTRPTECPSPHPTPGPIIQANYMCWLNEYCHKTRVDYKPIESAQFGPASCAQRCYYVVDGKEFPEAFGSTKKEAKEQAAKAVYEELMREVADESQTGDAPRQDKTLSQSVSTVCSDRPPVAVTLPLNIESNYIGNLNTYCQKLKRVCDYKLVGKKGPAHTPLFVYKVVIDKKEYPEGQGNSAKEARQHAAQLAWDAINEQSDWDGQAPSRSAVSEDDSSSPPSSVGDSQDKAEANNKTGSTSEFVIFKDSSVAINPKMASIDAKPKIKMAPHFFNNVKNNNLGKSPEKTTQSADSLFLKEYDQIAPIGKGGFGRVFRARKKIEDKNVAVKIVKSTVKAHREVGALSKLQHHNIVRYYHAWIEDTRYQLDPSDTSSSTSDSGSTTKYMYIQMELCEGGTRWKWIKERNRKSIQETRNEKALDILQQVTEGVNYIHSEKLIHRDLKPANILFASDGTVKIGDFGLVTSADSDNDEALLERTKKTGTRSYMSPEQLNQGKYDKEVDIFALGLIYFEVLWTMTTENEKGRIWAEVRGQKFPPQFCMDFRRERKLIKRMLSEKPEDRPDAPEIASELNKYLTNIKNDQHELQEMKTY